MTPEPIDTWAVTDKLRCYRNGKLVWELKIGFFGKLVYDLVKAMRD